MRLARPLSVFVLAMLAGCMLPRPPVADYTANCLVPGPPPAGAILFLTTRLPDCRDPGGTRMSWHRGEQPWHGVWAANGPQFYRHEQWITELDRQLAAYPETPVLYIHGFNNDNGAALSRAAAIRLAVGGDRPVIALTWPSYASKRKYFWDEANAEWTVHAGRDLLEQFAKRQTKVIIVAHSMGNRIALDLLRSWPTDKGPLPVEKLIMASPDVDRDWFAKELGRGFGAPITLYGSTRDQALSASWRSHGYARAGDLSRWVSGHDFADPFPYRGATGMFVVVDTSDIAKGIANHADFIESWQGAADLCRVITGVDPSLGRSDTDEPQMKRLRREPETGDPCTAAGGSAARYLNPGIELPNSISP